VILERFYVGDNNSSCMSKSAVKKLRIFFDTNVFWDDNPDDFQFVFNSKLKNIHGFVDQHELSEKVTLCVSETVLQERVYQKAKEAQKMFDVVTNGITQLEKLDIVYELKKAPNESFNTQLEKSAFEQLKKCKVEYIEIPSSITPTNLLHRSCAGVKPFSGKDKGMRDTLVWLSLLEDAKKHVDCDYVLCTDNWKENTKNNGGDFSPDILKAEFSDEIGKKQALSILRTIDDVTSLLDERYALNLELQKKHDLVRNIINRNIGFAIMQANQELEKYNTPDQVSYVSSKKYLTFDNPGPVYKPYKNPFYSQASDDTKVVAYVLSQRTNAVDISFIHEDPLDVNLVKAVVILKLTPIYRQKDFVRNVYDSTVYWWDGDWQSVTDTNTEPVLRRFDVVVDIEKESVVFD